jgi:hypothetical protein
VSDCLPGRVYKALFLLHFLFLSFITLAPKIPQRQKSKVNDFLRLCSSKRMLPQAIACRTATPLNSCRRAWVRPLCRRGLIDVMMCRLERIAARKGDLCAMMHEQNQNSDSANVLCWYDTRRPYKAHASSLSPFLHPTPPRSTKFASYASYNFLRCSLSRKQYGSISCRRPNIKTSTPGKNVLWTGKDSPLNKSKFWAHMLEQNRNLRRLLRCALLV